MFTNRSATARDFVASQGWQLVDVYADDGIGASDKSRADRIQFPRLMADVRAGLIDVIVATEFTRLYRRPRRNNVVVLSPPVQHLRAVRTAVADGEANKWNLFSGAALPSR
jgi:DNA invertase Pin-like site-specific DNA recombinase